ncbi:MAG: tyrosine-type recombinase/integrase [Muribaculaceae bacterium]|nr:tyrosine-type recombinase/integrase [Muribaculaceae bacterium]
MRRITQQLSEGWNPWIEKDCSNLMTIADVMANYEAYVDKMYNGGNYRKQTYASYKSYIKNFEEYINKNAPIYYLYQLDKGYITRFLDHIFIERDNGARTRNNYLSWLAVFCGWCVDHNYLQYRPTDGIAFIDKRHIRKQRELIPLPIIEKISKWVEENDPHFLLACQLLYNCFIRPVEMTRLTINMINIEKNTITIPADVSKNHETMVITIPKKVITTARNLGIFEHEGSCFIFSKRLRPGRTMIDTVVFRHHWENVRKSLKLKNCYQFYSLKDTGITEMLDNKIASITVRDQARHSSLAITEIYTRHLAKANPDVVNWKGSL